MPVDRATSPVCQNKKKEMKKSEKKEICDNRILIFHPAFVNASLNILRSV